MIPQWSYSRLTCFEKCPKQAEFKFVKKIKEPGSAAMDRGKEVHKLCEDYIRGNNEEVPAQLKDFELCAGALQISWGRAKVDAFVYEEGVSKEARVIDFKTGRYDGNQESHREQCELYGAVSLSRYPELEKITTEMWYLDHGKIDRYIYTPETIKVKRERLNNRALAMTTATEFPATPSMFKCKWCYFGKQNMCREVMR